MINSKRFKALLLLLSMTIVIGLSGCGNKPVNTEKDADTNKEQQNPVVAEQEKEGPVSRLDGLKQSFKDEGFNVGENEIIAFEIINASNGMKFTLDDELIEIYEYDMANLSDEAKVTVEQAQEGYIDLSGIKLPVKFKDGLLLARHDEHSQGEKIVKIFDEYK